MRVKSVPPLAGILCIGLLFSWAAAAAAEDGEDEMDDMMEDYFEYYMRESTRSGNPCSKLNYQCILPYSYFFFFKIAGPRSERIQSLEHLLYLNCFNQAVQLLQMPKKKCHQKNGHYKNKERQKTE